MTRPLHLSGAEFEAKAETFQGGGPAQRGAIMIEEKPSTPKIYRYVYSLPGKTVDLTVQMPELTEEDLEGIEELFRLIIQVQRRAAEPEAPPESRSEEEDLGFYGEHAP